LKAGIHYLDVSMSLLAESLTGSGADLLALVESFSQRHMVVVGDLVADQFLSGSISRVSREAPVLILRHEETDTRPGGAANCAANLAALGARVSLVGAVGDDLTGVALLAKLGELGVDCHGVAVVPGAKTTTKVRVLAGQIHAARQQVLRIDHDDEPARVTGIDELLQSHLRTVAGTAGAIIISDYNYGVASAPMASAIRTAARAHEVPVLVDSRYRLLDFCGFTTATPNEDEVEQLLNRRLAGREEFASACEALRQELGCEALLVTRGSAGMILLEPEQPALQLEAIGSRQPVDVTGAGDTVIAAYALGLASGGSFASAATIANHAGGVVVMKKGTATLSPEELADSLARLSQ
jgi:rfaE bifunctional protein kinase chain/domain